MYQFPVLQATIVGAFKTNQRVGVVKIDYGRLLWVTLAPITPKGHRLVHFCYTLSVLLFIMCMLVYGT